MRYYVSRQSEAGGSSGLLQKEKRMSREDDFDDIVGSPDDLDAAQDDTSEPLLEDESVDESPATDIGYVERARVLPAEPVEEEMPAPAARKVAKKKKKATAKPKPKPKPKPKTKPKPKAKKKTKKAAKPARKPSAKKTAKKPAKKKTKPAAKKKKAGKPRPKK